MQKLLKNRTFYEAVFVTLITLGFGIGIGFLGAISPKFQVALGIGMFGLLVIALVPERRTFCLFLWVLVQPLSIEKILYKAAPLWPEMRGQEVLINAGDLILGLLAIILCFDKFILRKPIVFWDEKSKIFLGLIAWAIVSYLIHMLYLKSDFIQSTPIGLLHLIKMLLFMIILQASIQTRADLIWVLVAVLIIVLFESGIVMLSVATGESYSFMRLLGQTTDVQSYAVGGGELIRGSGTVGVSNQQALFHTMYTFLLVGFFAVKRPIFHVLAIAIILLSFVATLLTFARTAWLGVALASMFITVVFIYRKKFTPKTWVIGSILSLVFVVLLTAAIEPIYKRLTSGDNGATGSRVRMMLLAKDLFLQYPIIGVGQAGYPEAGLKLYPPGSVNLEWVALGEKAIVPPLGRVELAVGFLGGQKIIVPLSVHNKFLLVLSELGIVGLMIWLLLFYQFYKEIRNCSKSKDNLFQYIGVAGLAILLATGVYMMLDLIADDKTTQLLLFPLLVISAANRLNNKLNN